MMEIMQPDSLMAYCDPRIGKYMAVSLKFEGDIVPKEVNAAAAVLKNALKFVDWCPTGLKCGINYNSPMNLPDSDFAKTTRNLCSLSNSTAISQVFKRFNAKFDMLFSKRSFVHWYVGSGMEEGELSEAREDMEAMIRDYDEIENYVQEEDEDI
jgi:tubulin alpha